MNEKLLKLLRQAIRFLFVGGIFTILDIVLHYVLVMIVKVGPIPLPTYIGERLGRSDPESARSLGYTLLKACTATFATANSFYWNRKWTFEAGHTSGTGRQFLRFVAVAGSGMVVNTLIAGFLSTVIVGSDKMKWLGSTLIATAAVTLWNFWGHRLWTFSSPTPQPVLNSDAKDTL